MPPSSFNDYAPGPAPVPCGIAQHDETRVEEMEEQHQDSPCRRQRVLRQPEVVGTTRKLSCDQLIDNYTSGGRMQAHQDIPMDFTNAHHMAPPHSPQMQRVGSFAADVTRKLSCDRVIDEFVASSTADVSPLNSSRASIAASQSPACRPLTSKSPRPVARGTGPILADAGEEKNKVRPLLFPFQEDYYEASKAYSNPPPGSEPQGPTQPQHSNQPQLTSRGRRGSVIEENLNMMTRSSLKLDLIPDTHAPIAAPMFNKPVASKEAPAGPNGSTLEQINSSNFGNLYNARECQSLCVSRAPLTSLGVGVINSQDNIKGKGTKAHVINIVDKITQQHAEQVTYANSCAEQLILPDSPFAFYWSLLILLLVVSISILAPLRLAFDIDSDPEHIEAWLIFDITVDVLFILDILVSFRTAFYRDGVLIVDRNDIAWTYVRSGQFLMDLLTSFPLDLVLKASESDLKAGGVNKMLRLFRVFKLVRILRLTKFLRGTESLVNFNPSMLRLLKILLVLILSWHLIGCFYWWISLSEGFGNDDWVPALHLLNATFGTRYLQAYMWALVVTTGIGYDIIPYSNNETMFTIVTLVVGMFLYACVVGSAASVLSRWDATAEVRQEKMDIINQYLRNKQVIPDIRRKVNAYFDYIHDNHYSTAEQSMMQEMPQSLMTQIRFCIYRRLLQNSPLFKGCDTECSVMLVQCLRPVVGMPGEYVIQEGEKGSCMFFVNNGQLAVFLESNQNVLAFLQDGDYFGEGALLTEETRNSSILSVTYCDMLALHVMDFKRVCSVFPKFKDFVTETVKKRKIERRWKAATKIAQAVGKLNLLAKNTLSGKRRATEERRASEEAAAIKNKAAPEAASKNKVTPEGPENI